MIKNAYKRCFLKGAGAEAGISDRRIRLTPVMACLWWGRGPRICRLALIRSPEDDTDGHLRFHGETVIARINGLY